MTRWGERKLATGAELLGPFRKAHRTSVSCRAASTKQKMSKAAKNWMKKEQLNKCIRKENPPDQRASVTVLSSSFSSFGFLWSCTAPLTEKLIEFEEEGNVEGEQPGGGGQMREGLCMAGRQHGGATSVAVLTFCSVGPGCQRQPLGPDFSHPGSQMEEQSSPGNSPTSALYSG
ncbi:hypothetical protein Q8A73_017109 [Channa argus]|nr:hypothetical protein Q8A73_017109 [Channa argus]